MTVLEEDADANKSLQLDTNARGRQSKEFQNESRRFRACLLRGMVVRGWTPNLQFLGRLSEITPSTSHETVDVRRLPFSTFRAIFHSAAKTKKTQKRHVVCK